MSDAREDDLLTTDAGGSGTGDALTPEGAGHRPAPGSAGGGQDGALVTDPATTDAGPRGPTTVRAAGTSSRRTVRAADATPDPPAGSRRPPLLRRHGGPHGPALRDAAH